MNVVAFPIPTAERAPASPEAPAMMLKATDLVSQAESLILASRAEYDHAADLTKHIKVFSKKVEEERKRMVGPLNDHVAMINADYKKISEPLKQAETVIKEKMLAFAQELEKKAREAQEQRRQEQQARAFAEAAEAEFWNQTERAEAALNAAVEAELPPAQLAKAAPARGDFGAIAAIRKIWTFEVTDLALVPREFLEINEKAVKAAMSAGATDIPGLRIFQKDSMAVR